MSRTVRLLAYALYGAAWSAVRVEDCAARWPALLALSRWADGACERIRVAYYRAADAANEGAA